MKVLILNSGKGTRMGRYTSEHPKCMTDLLNGETILSRQLKMLEKVGVDEVVITTGYFRDVLIDYCLSLGLNLKYTFVHNDMYDETNYIYSIYCAKEHIKNQDIIMLHGDLVFEESVLRDVFAFKESCMKVSSTIPLPEKEGNVLGKRYDWLLPKKKEEGYEDDYRIVAMYAYSVEKPQTKTFTATIRGAKGYDYIEFERLGGNTEVFLNGERLGDNFTHRMPRCSLDCYNRPYRFYCNFAEVNELKLVCTYTEADQPVASGYIKIGRIVEADDWSVRLHYGRARVFVKPDGEAKVKLIAELLD